MERKVGSLKGSNWSKVNSTTQSSLYDPADIAKRKPPKKFRYVLLMGETGSGKSTFINYLANYFLEGTIESPKTIIPTKWKSEPTVPGYASHSEADVSDQSRSQTLECRMYSFLKNGIIYRFIDSPGFSDTTNSANNSVDNQITTSILTAVSKLKELHAIILIVNGSSCKSTASTKTARQKIAGNFPDVFNSNMLAIFTFTEVKSELIPYEKMTFRTPKKFFYMANSRFNDASDLWTMEVWERQVKCWNKSMKEISNIVDTITHMKPRLTGVFRNMLVCRNEINSLFMRYINQIDREQSLLEKFEKLKIEEEEIQFKIDHDHNNLLDSEKEIIFYDAQQRENMETRLQAEGEQQMLEMHGNLLNALKQKCSYHLAQENHLQQLKEEALDKKKVAEMTISQTKQLKVECETRRAAINAEIQEAQRELEDAVTILLAKYRDLKTICSYFDYVAELNATKDSFQVSLYTLRDENSRKNVEAFIRTLGQLAEDLNKRSF